MGDNNLHTGEYSLLIKKIRKKRSWAAALAAISAILVLFFSGSTRIVLPEKTVWEFPGLHPAVTIVLLILIYLAYIIAYCIISIPLNTSLNTECDPQKYLALNTTLGNRNQTIPACASGYLYAGDFTRAMMFTEQLIFSGKQKQIIFGFFGKARCEFQLGDVDALKVTAQQFESALSTIKRTNTKTRMVYQKLHNILLLLCALSDRDTEKIDIYRKLVQPWGPSKAIEGYVNYLRGIAAFYVGDTHESIYRLTAVKDHCGKTVFSKLADTYLDQLK